MRVCKLAKTDELVSKHGRYAEVLGLKNVSQANGALDGSIAEIKLI